MEHVLVDVWRVHNPESENFTWRQKNPLIQRRLDYCFISDSLQDDVVKTDIITAINTHNLAVVLGVNSLAEYPEEVLHFGSLITVYWTTPILSNVCATIFLFGLVKSVIVKIKGYNGIYIKYKIRQEKLSGKKSKKD